VHGSRWLGSGSRPSRAQDVVVETSCGKVRGVQQPGVQVFRGIRYEESTAVAASWQAIFEEIIAALSRFRYLSIIVGNSSFAYKVKNTDVKRVGCE
jgi:TolB-like protein